MRQAPRGPLGLRRGQREPLAGDDVVRAPAAPLVPENLGPDRRVRLGHPLSHAKDVDKRFASKVLRRGGTLLGGGTLLLLAIGVADSAPCGRRGTGALGARANPCLCGCTGARSIYGVQ